MGARPPHAWGSPPMAGRRRRGKTAFVPPSTPLFRSSPRRAVVRVLEGAPQRAVGLPPPSRRAAITRCLGVKLTLDEGPWRPPQDADRLAGWFGLLVMDGLLARKVEVEGLRAQEVIG